MTSATAGVERPGVKETMRLEESLESHLSFAGWVRSVGGSVEMSSGLLTIVEPDGAPVAVPENSVVEWDGEAFSLCETEGVRHGQQRQEQR